MNSKYRKIDTAEIELLKSNACTAEDWDRIWVKDGFNPENIHHANFSGTVKMGVFNKVFILNGGMKLKSGIRHASIHNCEIYRLRKSQNDIALSIIQKLFIVR